MHIQGKELKARFTLFHKNYELAFYEEWAVLRDTTNASEFSV